MTSDFPKARPLPELVDRRLIKALAHPTRAHILNILNDGPSSPSKISKRLNGVGLNLTCHHIKVLEDLDCVELTGTVPHGGRKERIYRATKRHRLSAAEWAEVAERSRQPITVGILQMVSEDLNASLATGKFDERIDNHLSRIPIEVDERGWAEIVLILKRTMEQVLNVGERSVERAQLTEDQLAQIRVVIMQFLQAESDD